MNNLYTPQHEETIATAAVALEQARALAEQEAIIPILNQPAAATAAAVALGLRAWHFGQDDLREIFTACAQQPNIDRVEVLQRVWLRLVGNGHVDRVGAGGISTLARNCKWTQLGLARAAMYFDSSDNPHAGNVAAFTMRLVVPKLMDMAQRSIDASEAMKFVHERLLGAA